MRYAPAIGRLLEELERLPGIGPKSAQRLTYHILRADEPDVQRLADAISEVKKVIHFWLERQETPSPNGATAPPC